jgi:hypothetical protein
MNLNRVKLVGDHPQYYEMHDGKGSFRVAKSGLSDELHQKIRSMAEPMADGGKVKRELTDVTHVRPPQQIRRDRERQMEEEETGRILTEDEITQRLEKKDKRLTGEREVGPPDESAFAKAGRVVSDLFRKSTASAASRPATIPRYAEGGAVDPSRTGGAYGLGLPPGVQFGPAATYSLAPNPAAEAMAPPTNLQAPSAPAPMTRTLVQTGSAPDGSPVVESREVELQSPIPGLRPRESASAAQPTQPAPSVTVPGVGASNYGSGLMRQAVDEQRSALSAKGEAEAEQARNTAAALGAAQKQLEANALEQKQLAAQAKSDGSAMMGQYRQALDDMRKVDTTVDPGQYWASKTTGQKVLGIIGLALGAVGAGNDGVNKAAQMMSHAIDRDVEAQKAEISARLAKGERAISGAQSMYAMNRQIFGDDLAAVAATKATALEIANNQLQQVAATAASPIAKANAQALSAQLTAARAEFEAKAADRAVDNEYKKAMAAAALGKAASGPATDQEALHTAQQVRERAQAIRDNLATAEAIVKRSGTFEALGADQATLNNALNSIATDMSKLKDPTSAARPGEVEQEVANIGFKAGDLTTRNSTALELLRRYRRAVDEREQYGLKVRGFIK